MMVQRVLKGIAGLDPAAVRGMLRGGGIRCNWWRNVPGGTITPTGVVAQLVPAHVPLHLTDYDELDPATNETYGAASPFISTTAGSVVRDADNEINEEHAAEEVAAYFATDGYRTDGWVFDGYVFTLGRPAVEQRAFAEEVRELHIYTEFLPYQPEGELLAKVNIPATQLRGAWPLTHEQGAGGRALWPTWGDFVPGDVYVEPERLVNYRDVL